MVESLTVLPRRIRAKGNILNARSAASVSHVRCTNTRYSTDSDIGRRYFSMDSNVVFKDMAVTGHSNVSGFSFNSTYVSTSVGDNGTTVSNSDTSSEARVYSAKKPGASYDSWEGPVTLEVDILGSSGTVSVQIYKSSNAASKFLSSLGISNGGHLRVVYDGTDVKYYVNGDSTPVVDPVNVGEITGFHIRFGFGASASVAYRNFVIYEGD